jgi:predicted TIM-barrel fold metal-dependent hydrolase
LHAVFYRDAQRANEELLAETARYPSRFVPIGTINPRYAGWERDLAELVERRKVKAITLVPEHHGYALADEHGRAALQRITELGVPVMLMQRFEDRRQRHHWDKAEDLQVTALLEAARVHPELRFLLVNWIGLDGLRLAAAGLKLRCLIDIARIQVVYRKEVPRLIEALGVEAVAFGSHMPFDYVGPSLIKLANIEQLRPADRDALAWRNAAKFLGLD